MKDIAQTESGPASAGMDPRVLVIGDDDQFRGYLVELLTTRGYEVFQAGNDLEGLRLFEGHQPQLVITDIVMPEEEGVGLIWQLRRDNPRLPIIAVSGGNKGFGEDYLRIAQKLGANATLSSPLQAANCCSSWNAFWARPHWHWGERAELVPDPAGGRLLKSWPAEPRMSGAGVGKGV